jgi:hypothetical protein
VDQFTSPPGWEINQWLGLIDAACWLYENFGSQAVRAHWSALDLFGVSPDGPGAGGIAERIGNARNLKLGEGLAYWSFMGSTGRFKRGSAGSNLIPLWELSK